MTSVVTVVGAGHWLLAQDRVGPLVLERLEGRYGPEVELVAVGTTGLALLDHLHGQKLLVVVDACVLGGRPGEIHVVEPDLDAAPRRETSVHQIGPIEALTVARHLFPESMPERALLVLVETEGLAADDEDFVCRRVVERIDREVEQVTGRSTEIHAGRPAEWREERGVHG